MQEEGLEEDRQLPVRDEKDGDGQGSLPVRTLVGRRCRSSLGRSPLPSCFGHLTAATVTDPPPLPAAARPPLRTCAACPRRSCRDCAARADSAPRLLTESGRGPDAVRRSRCGVSRRLARRGAGAWAATLGPRVAAGDREAPADQALDVDEERALLAIAERDGAARWRPRGRCGRCGGRSSRRRSGGRS